MALPRTPAGSNLPGGVLQGLECALVFNRFRAMLRLLSLVSVIAAACGGHAPPSTQVVEELGRIAPLRPGEPVLVFVYTDG